MYRSKAIIVTVIIDALLTAKATGALNTTTPRGFLPNAMKRNITEKEGMLTIPMRRSVTARIINNTVHGSLLSLVVASAIINSKLDTVVGHANRIFIHEQE